MIDTQRAYDRYLASYRQTTAIKDPAMKLRLVRGQVATQLWLHRAKRHEYRVRANDAIDVGDKPMTRAYNEAIKTENDVITALRLVAEGLRTQQKTKGWER